MSWRWGDKESALFSNFIVQWDRGVSGDSGCGDGDIDGDEDEDEDDGGTITMTTERVKFRVIISIIEDQKNRS